MEYSKKKQLEKAVEEIFITSLNNRIFSACSLAVSSYKNGAFERVFFSDGFTELNKNGKKIVKTTVFDLASLTKPLVTVLSVYTLISLKKLKMTDKLGHFFPEIDKTKKNISIKQLLCHSSGLSAHKEYFTLYKKISPEKRKETVLKAILVDELDYEPGEKYVYSDLGFLLLGWIIEKVTGKDLDLFWNEYICLPMGLSEKLFFPEQTDEQEYAVTGNCPWSGRKLEGLVHDDNCRFLGGKAGHAGLFGTVEGVTALCEQILSSINSLNNKKIDIKDIKSWVQRIPGSNWSLGFDMVSRFGSSSGKYFSAESIGHLGFTGVSFWMDVERNIIVVFLTNRVISPDNNSMIKKIRPKLHDAVMRVLLDKE